MSRAATCASHSDRRASHRRRPAAIALAGALAVAGCFMAVREATRPVPFDHAAHAKRDLACADCHEGAKSGARAGLPPPDMCANCHNKKDDKPPIAASVAEYGRRFTSGEKLYGTGSHYADVIFSHQQHAAAKVDCTACHTSALTGAAADPHGPPAMNECMDCHRTRGAKNECATCHSAVRKETPPSNHGPTWRFDHGPITRVTDRAVTAERCDYCHARADCDACHAKDAPRDHTNPFRVSTHGLSASMDRSRCMACHQADSCDRCHLSTMPRTHTGTFGAPRDRHCLECHFPVKDETCVLCHKQGAPSHAQAPPKPPDHTAGMNCRMCHGRGAPMPHVDNLTECNVCHR